MSSVSPSALTKELRQVDSNNSIEHCFFVAWGLYTKTEPSPMLSRTFAAAEGAYAMHTLIKGAYANAFAVHRNSAAVFRSVLLSFEAITGRVCPVCLRILSATCCKKAAASSVVAHLDMTVSATSLASSRLYLAVKSIQVLSWAGMNAKEGLSFLSLECLWQQMHFQKVPGPWKGHGLDGGCRCFRGAFASFRVDQL